MTDDWAAMQRNLDKDIATRSPIGHQHETHVCRDCGAVITLPYVQPEPPLVDGCRIVHRGDGFDVCKVHYRHWKTGTQMCPGRQ